MLSNFKVLISCLVLANSILSSAANLLDFCDYRNKLVESNVGLEIPILKSRISSSTFGDFVRNKSFQNHFQNVFNERIIDADIEWRTNTEQMYMVPLNKFIPKTLGCVFKSGYNIKSLINRTTIDVAGLVKVINEDVYYEIIKDTSITNVPVIVFQGSSIRESVFCIFGELFVAQTYFIMQCLFEPSMGSEIPKLIKITRTSETMGRTGRVLCSSHFPKYCANYKINNSTNEILVRSGIPPAVNNVPNNGDSTQVFNITTVPSSFKQLFRHFYCYNCTINIQVKD